MQNMKIHNKAGLITLLSIYHVLSDILVKGKATQECQYIYILEGLIVPGICSHNTCHSNNTCFNAKCENYTTKLGV